MKTVAEVDRYRGRKHWTQAECTRLEEFGVLAPGKYELLEGVIYDDRGQNIPHRLANGRTYLALTLVFGPDYVLLPGTLLIDPENSPEPDVSVTNREAHHYATQGNPATADLRLVVEISDTTLWRDLNTKADLYSRAGIPEYRVVDINNRQLWVHRQATNAATPI